MRLGKIFGVKSAKTEVRVAVRERRCWYPGYHADYAGFDVQDSGSPIRSFQKLSQLKKSQPSSCAIVASAIPWNRWQPWIQLRLGEISEAIYKESQAREQKLQEPLQARFRAFLSCL